MATPTRQNLAPLHSDDQRISSPESAQRTSRPHHPNIPHLSNTTSGPVPDINVTSIAHHPVIAPFYNTSSEVAVTPAHPSGLSHSPLFMPGNLQTMPSANPQPGPAMSGLVQQTNPIEDRRQFSPDTPKLPSSSDRSSQESRKQTPGTSAKAKNIRERHSHATSGSPSQLLQVPKPQRSHQQSGTKTESGHSDGNATDGAAPESSTGTPGAQPIPVTDFREFIFCHERDPSLRVASIVNDRSQWSFDNLTRAIHLVVQNNGFTSGLQVAGQPCYFQIADDLTFACMGENREWVLSDLGSQKVYKDELASMAIDRCIRGYDRANHTVTAFIMLRSFDIGVSRHLRS